MFPWLTNGKQPVKIAVIGDMILDEYLGGNVSRISPEAPVPVHLVTKTSYSAGGAANVARNIQLSGGQALLFGVWGKDESATILKNLLKEDAIDISGVLTVTDRPTVKKTRIIASSQQIIRVDWEKNHPITPEQQTALIDKLRLADYRAILISDYGKGSLPRELIEKVIALAAQKNTPVVVDPKGKDFYRYKGCKLITPNRKEALEALGVDLETSVTGEELARQLQIKFGLSDVLVTMGAEGMVYQPQLENGKFPDSIHKKPKAREVFDVSGAGDTVAAIITLSLGADCPVEKSMDLANLAAGLVVEKLGTQPVTLKELEDAHDQIESAHPYCTESKIMSQPKLLARINDLKLKGKKIVFTNGCFDLLHAGHLTYLEAARALGDILVIGVNTDESIKKLKGDKRPIVELVYRMRILAGLACVDFVTSFAEDTPLNLISSLMPHVLVKGSDYLEENIVGASIVKESGGSVARIPLVEGLSTSRIVEKIESLKL